MHAAQQDSFTGAEGARGLDMLVIKRREKGGKTKAKYEGYRTGRRGRSLLELLYNILSGRY